MRVINEGPKWSYTCSCRGCQSVLQADAGDIRVGWFGANYGGESPDEHFYLVCPVCGTQNLLPRSTAMPPAVVRQIRES